MELLVASVTALLVGPVLVHLLMGRWQWLALLDGFVLVSLLGIIVLELFPSSIAMGGVAAAIAAVVGILLPPLLDRWFGDIHGKVHGTMLWLAMLGLAFHAMLDGAALLSAHGHGHEHDRGGSLLALGVILHRIPLGLTIWWAVRPSRGRRAALGIVASIALATVVGFLGSRPLLRALPLELLAVFQALVAGSLLHVVFGHQPRRMEQIVSHRKGWSTVGAGLAAAMVAVAAHAHPTELPAEVLPAGETFVTLALESAPALVLAFAGAGLLRGLLQRMSSSWLTGGGRVGEAGRGIVFGLPLPICSCGVLPVYQTLVSRGAPIAAAVAFLIATPELGLDALLITVPLLGWKLAAVRLAAATVVALVVAVLVAGVAKRPAVIPAECVAPTDEPFVERLRSGLRFGFGELADHIGPWILVGLLVAALLEPMMRDDWLARLPPGIDVPVAALVGLPGYVCASGATPLAAILMHKGLSAGGAIAFLLTGPATNVTTFAVLSSLHGRRFAVAFAATVTGTAVAAGYVANLWLGDHPAIPLHETAAEGGSILETICLGVLALMMVGSVWRQGPRGFIGQLLGDAHDHHDHDHDHDHDDHHHGHEPIDGELPLA